MRRRNFMTVLAGAAAYPLLAGAQQKAMPVIGFLASGSGGPFEAGLRQGLSEAGYIEGQNLVIEYRYAGSRYDRLPALAADLVGRKVDVIVTSGGTPPARAAKDATSTIPIVFVGGNPVADGLVASLARPESNITGMFFMTSEMMPKRLELLCELVPQARVIALLVNPNNLLPEPLMRDVQDAARAKGVQLHVLNASTENEINAAFETLVKLHIGGLVLGPDPFLNSRREQLIRLAAGQAVPVIYDFRENAAAGGLISYGPSLAGIWRQVGSYVGRILKGTKPADLPVQQPAKFELIVNLKTARDIGLTIPPAILALADEVIE